MQRLLPPFLRENVSMVREPMAPAHSCVER
jgi:hypothetical protein